MIVISRGGGVRVQPPAASSGPPSDFDDWPLLQPADLTYVGAINNSQFNTGNQRSGFGERLFDVKPLGQAPNPLKKGFLIPSHISETFADGGSGVLTFEACVVDITGLTPTTGAIGGGSTASAQLETWYDPFNVNHTANVAGRWTKAFQGSTPGFNCQYGGGIYFTYAGDPYIVMTVANSYQDERFVNASYPTGGGIPSNKPVFFVRPAELAATGLVTAHNPILRDAFTNAIICGNTAGSALGKSHLSSSSLINFRHVQGGLAPIPDAEWRAALGVDLLCSFMPMSRYPPGGYGYTCYGLKADQLFTGVDGDVDCIRFQAYDCERAMNGYNATDNKPPGTYPLGIPLQPNSTNGAYDVDKAGTPKTNEGDASPLFSAAGEVWSGATKGDGFRWVPGTNTVIWFGIHAYGNTWYGDPDGPTGSGLGYQSTDFRNHALFFDARDWLRVKNGTLNPWEVEPYAIWNYPTHGATGSEKTGVALDNEYSPTEGIIWVRNPDQAANPAGDPVQEVCGYTYTRVV